MRQGSLKDYEREFISSFIGERALDNSEVYSAGVTGQIIAESSDIETSIDMPKDAVSLIPNMLN